MKLPSLKTLLVGAAVGSMLLVGSSVSATPAKEVWTRLQTSNGFTHYVDWAHKGAAKNFAWVPFKDVYHQGQSDVRVTLGVFVVDCNTGHWQLFGLNPAHTDIVPISPEMKEDTVITDPAFTVEHLLCPHLHEV